MRSSQHLANALVLAGSAALLGGALGSQYFGGLFPCEMCLWQRWPHVAALAIGLIAWAAGSNRLPVALAALCVLVSGAIGGYHAGVEWGMWQGLTACTATPVGGSGADLIGALIATPLIRCDVAQWTLFGVSLAGYNAVLSTLIGGAALWMIRKPS